VERLDHPPRGGDELKTDGYRVAVRKTRQILVHEAYVEALDNVAADEQAPTK
jgi:hypothetical protein